MLALRDPFEALVRSGEHVVLAQYARLLGRVCNIVQDVADQGPQLAILLEGVEDPQEGVL